MLDGAFETPTGVRAPTGAEILVAPVEVPAEIEITCLPSYRGGFHPQPRHEQHSQLSVESCNYVCKRGSTTWLATVQPWCTTPFSAVRNYAQLAQGKGEYRF